MTLCNIILSMVDGFEFKPEKILEMLPKMGEGMLCIFIVIGIIILVTAILNKVTSKKQ